MGNNLVYTHFEGNQWGTNGNKNICKGRTAWASGGPHRYISSGLDIFYFLVKPLGTLMVTIQVVCNYVCLTTKSVPKGCIRGVTC